MVGLEYEVLTHRVLSVLLAQVRGISFESNEVLPVFE